MAEIRRKLVIVGDGACGKTCLLMYVLLNYDYYDSHHSTPIIQPTAPPAAAAVAAALLLSCSPC